MTSDKTKKHSDYRLTAIIISLFIVVMFASVNIYTNSDSYNKKQCLKIDEKVAQAECFISLYSDFDRDLEIESLLKKNPEYFVEQQMPTRLNEESIYFCTEEQANSYGVCNTKEWRSKTHDELYCTYNPTDEEKCECMETTPNAIYFKFSVSTAKIFMEDIIFIGEDGTIELHNETWKCEILRPFTNSSFVGRDCKIEKMFAENICIKAKPKEQALEKLEQNTEGEK